MASNDMPYLDPHNSTQLQSLVTLVDNRAFHEFTIPEQREIFGKVQAPRPENPGITISDHDVQTSHGAVKTYLYMPKMVREPVPFVYFVHGGGWIYGGAVEYEAFIFELVVRTGLAVVVPDYTLAPEKRYPVQQEQCLEILQDILKLGQEYGLATEKVVIMGDSSGGQIVAAMCLMKEQRMLALPITHQVLLHPWIDVTAAMHTGIMRDPQWSEQQLTAYFSKQEERSSVLAAPGCMTGAQAKCMPATTIITADQDQFREQDEAFAKLLQAAGVPCGVIQAFGSLHDVEVFREARESPTARLVMLAVCGLVKDALA